MPDPPCLTACGGQQSESVTNSVTLRSTARGHKHYASVLDIPPNFATILQWPGILTKTKKPPLVAQLHSQCTSSSLNLPRWFATPTAYLEILGANSYPTGNCACKVSMPGERSHWVLSSVSAIVDSMNIHDLTRFERPSKFWSTLSEYKMGSLWMMRKRDNVYCATEEITSRRNGRIIELLWTNHMEQLTRSVRKQLIAGASDQVLAATLAADITPENRTIFDAIILNARRVISLKVDCITAHCMSLHKQMPQAVVQIIIAYVDIDDYDKANAISCINLRIERLEESLISERERRDEYEEKMASFGDDMYEYSQNTNRILDEMREEIRACQQDLNMLLTT